MANALRHVLLLALLFAVPSAAAMRIAGDAPFSGTPVEVVVDPQAREAYVRLHEYHDGRAAIVVVSLDTLATRSIPIDDGAVQMLLDGARGRVYVTHAQWPAQYGKLSVIDVRTRDAPVDVIAPFARSPAGIAADFARGEIYVSDALTGVLWFLDAANPRNMQFVHAGANGTSLAVDRVHGRLFGLGWQYDSALMLVVDARARALQARIPVVDDSFLDMGLAQRVVIDDRRRAGYVLHSMGALSMFPLTGDPVEVRHVADGDRLWYGVGATSLAWGRLYELATDGLAWHVPGLNAAASSGALRSTDSSAVPRYAALPQGAGLLGNGLLVDDDGGDLYVTTTTRKLLRLDPETMATREVLDLPHVPELALLDPAGGHLLVIGSGAIVAVETRGAKAGTRVAAGFRHAGFDHRFVTADPIERHLLEDGRFGPDWQAVDDVFRVWSQPSAGTAPMCRFFSARFAPKSSHFYTPYANECEALKAGGEWQYEGIVFHVALPDANGGCAAGTEALYRLYNQGRSGAPNHWYTASRTTRDAAEREGWVVEGAGADRVFACTPTLR